MLRFAAVLLPFALQALPIHFEPNRGQAPNSALYTSRGVQFTATGPTFGPIRMTLPRTTPRALRPLPGRSNYLRPTNSVTGVPHFAELAYPAIFPGIGLVFHDSPAGLEYDFTIAPSADPSAIRLSFTGDARLESGSLIVRSGRAELCHRAPLAYQETPAGRRYIAAAYRLRRGMVTFDLGSYDRSLPLTIDPVLNFATYLGGSGSDHTAGIAIDSAGNTVIAGTTDSTDFPVTAGALQSTARATAGFVTRLDASGSTILSSTYVAGTSNVEIDGIALDSAGNVILTGLGDPTASGSAFVIKLSPGIDRVLLTANFGATPMAIAVDAAGSIYVTGTATAAFQTTAGAYQTALKGGLDAFVLKLSADGSRMVYATFLGGSGQEVARGIAVDSAGQVYLAGDTASADFPVTPGAAQTKFGGVVQVTPIAYGDAFAARLDPSGSRLLYATYLGGTEADIAYAVAVDAGGNAYIAGSTQSSDFPITGGFRTTYSGPAPISGFPDPSGDAFVTKLGPQGALLWSTYLGGASRDAAVAIALDAAGNPYVAGSTESADFPRTAGAIPDCHEGARPWVAELAASGANLLHSTGLSGSSFDEGIALALDSQGRVLLAGDATSRAFFSSASAAQPSYAGGGFDAFVARIDLNAAPQLAVGCILNAASYLAGNTGFFPDGAVAPGEIVTLFGVGLGPDPAVGYEFTSTGAISTKLDGMQVLFDGIPAPLLYASSTQLNAIVPYGVKSPATLVTVQRNGASDGPRLLPVNASVPTIFTADGSGIRQAAVLNQDLSYNSVANPAPRGSVISVYATGAGLMSPVQSDGAITTQTPPFPQLQLPITASIRGANARILYAGAAPGQVAGLVQINVEIPTTIDFGNSVPLSLTIGTQSTQLNVTIAVK